MPQKRKFTSPKRYPYIQTLVALGLIRYAKFNALNKDRSSKSHTVANVFVLVIS